MHTAYRADLDGLRAIAVSLVVLHHLGVVPGGYIGVDIFFTLSGYLITQTLPDMPLSTFYLRRIFRLFPALFATLVLTLALFPTPPVATTALCALSSLSNLYFYAHVSYFDADALSKPLLHTWSLSLEEQFYLLYPMLYRLLPRRLLPPTLLLLLSLSFLRSHHLLPSDPSAVFYLPHLRAWQFLLGALLSHHHASPLFQTHLPSRIPPNLAVLVALALIVYPALSYTADTPFPALAATPPAFATALLLLFAHHSSVATTVLASGAPVLVGRMSYSIYLVHWPLIVALGSRWEGLVAGKVAVCVLIVGVSVGLYVVIERPYRLRGAGGSAPGVTQAWRVVGVVGVFVFVVGAGVMGGGGRLVWEESGGGNVEVGDWVEGIMRGAGLDGGGNESGRLPRLAGGDVMAKMVGVEGRGGVLVLGDSHAGRMLAFAGYMGGKYGREWHVWSYPGCMAVFNVSKVLVSVGVGQGRVSGEQMKFCEGLVERWRGRSVGGEFGVVFLVSRWSTSVERGEYARRGPLAEYRLREGGEGVPGLNESRRVFERALRGTVREIVAGGSRVVIVSEVPDVGRGSYQCKRLLGRGRWGGKGQPAVCTGATREMAMRRVAYTNRVIRTVAREEEGVECIVPSDYFCDNYAQDGRHCRVVWRHKILYRDSDHLSDYGSLYLALRWEADRTAYFPPDWTVL